MKNPISSRPLVLAGNALSVLIAATERAHKGLPTTIINTGGPLGALQAGRCATWHDIAHPPSAPHRENPVIPRKKMSAAHN